MDDLVVLVYLWEYPAYFLVLQPKSQLGGHPLILGRPWLTTIDACINYRLGSMTISDGTETKIITLYPPNQPSLETETPVWMDLEEEEGVQSLLTIGKALTFKDETEDNVISSFMSEPTSINKHVYKIRNSTIDEEK